MYANYVTPTFQLEFDVALHIQWDGNQVVGNRAIYP